jgi:hypothetical protein
MNNVNELHEALARVVFADRKFPEVLADITAIARQEMPGTEAASITLIPGREAVSGRLRRPDGSGR